jgi:hypothetical protein
LQVLEAVYPEEGCIILAAAEQEARQVAQAAVASRDAAVYIPNLSGMLRCDFVPGGRRRRSYM